MCVVGEGGDANSEIENHKLLCVSISKEPGTSIRSHGPEPSTKQLLDLQNDVYHCAMDVLDCEPMEDTQFRFD